MADKDNAFHGWHKIGIANNFVRWEFGDSFFKEEGSGINLMFKLSISFFFFFF